QLASSTSGLILTLVLANMLSPEVFGEYRLLMSGLLILVVFTLPGMQTAIMESTPKGFKRNLVVAFKQMLKFGTLGALISLLIAIYYLTRGNTSLALGFTTIAISLPFFSSTSTYLFFLNSLKKFKEVTIYTSITRLS